MTSIGTRGSVSVAEWLVAKLSALPSIAALGYPAVWEDEIPDDQPLPAVVFQRIGPGQAIGPIGRPPSMYTYRYQWRVATIGADSHVIEAIAAEIGMALWYTNDSLPDGRAITSMEISADLPPVGSEGGNVTTEELGGEVEITLEPDYY